MKILSPSSLISELAQRPVKYFFTAFFLLLATMFIFGVKTTNAFDVSTLPQSIQDQIGDFDGNPSYPPTNYSQNECASYDPGYFPWISSPSQTNSTTITVPSGTTTVPLQLNNLVYVCHQAVSNGAVFPNDGTPVSPYNNGQNTLPVNQTFKISSQPTATVITGPGSENGTVGYTQNPFSIPGYGSQADRFWEGNNSTSALTFQTSTSQGITQTESVQINLSEVPVSYYNTGNGTVALCVVGDTVATSQSDPLSTCPSQLTTVTITINVNGNTGGTGNINGFKVDTNNNDTGSYSTANVTDCTTGAESAAQPFSFNGVPVGDNCVTAGTVAGYNVEGSTWCDSTTACDPGFGTNGENFTSGNSTTVVVTNGSTVQMRWIYVPVNTVQPGTDPCPPFAQEGYSDITNIQVNLPEPLPASSGAPPGYGTGYGTQETYTADVPATTVTGVVDSNPSTDTAGVTASVNGSYTTNPVNLDYSNYYATYAYDNDTPVVNYNFNYTEVQQPYSYTGGPVYSNGVLVGHSIVYGTPVTLNHVVAGQQDGPTMPECYDRTYNLQPNNGTLSWSTTGTPEDPEGVTYTGSVTETFGESNTSHQTDLRVPTSVSPITTSNTLEVFHEDSNGNLIESAYTGSCTPPNLNGTVYTESPSVTATYTSPVDVAQNCTATIPPLAYGDTICSVLGTNSSVGDVNQTGAITSTSVGLNVQPGPFPTTPSDVSADSYCTSWTAAEPYVKVFGGDATAGASSTDTNICFSNSAENIAAYNQGSGGDYAGSGTSLAALATGTISGFPSGQGPLPGGGQSLIQEFATAKYLTYANTDPHLTYGGDYGIGSSCPANNDFYAQASTYNGTPVPSATYTNLDSLPAGYYVDDMGAGGTLNNGNPIVLNPGEHLVLYATGAVTISANVTLNLGGISDASQLPTLELVTKGDIDIYNNVTQLAGNYIAENNTINDCSNIPPNQFFADPTDNVPNCGQQLVVDGAFVANTVDLYRTNGTIHQATTTETAGNSPSSAEDFDYSPLNWIVPTDSTNKEPLIQSITSLPPVL